MLFEMVDHVSHLFGEGRRSDDQAFGFVGWNAMSTLKLAAGQKRVQRGEGGKKEWWTFSLPPLPSPFLLSYVHTAVSSLQISSL